MSSFDLNSQTVKVTPEFRKCILALDSAHYTHNYYLPASSFEKLSVKETNNWLVYYYASLCNVLIAFTKTGDQIDVYCDKADKFVFKADSLSKNNSEIFVVKSIIAAARISVNVLRRGQKYSTLSTKLNEQAGVLNPQNPRVYLQKARLVLNTPMLFGGGAKKARPLFEMAVEKYKKFVPETVYHPNWGKLESIAELKKIL
jgi:hypothetical protein